jgi:hypothetical protein
MKTFEKYLNEGTALEGPDVTEFPVFAAEFQSMKWLRDLEKWMKDVIAIKGIKLRADDMQKFNLKLNRANWMDTLLDNLEIRVELFVDNTGVSARIGFDWWYNKMAGRGHNGSTINLWYKWRVRKWELPF